MFLLVFFSRSERSTLLRLHSLFLELFEMAKRRSKQDQVQEQQKLKLIDRDVHGKHT